MSTERCLLPNCLPLLRTLTTQVNTSFQCSCYRQNKARGGGTCVANHTSPIDAIMLACDGNYSFVSSSSS